MTETTDNTHPFGHHITVADLLARFDTCRAWEDRYRQLILLAKSLPALPDALKTEDISLSGCENRVWLGYQRQEDGRLHFYGDSDGRIVRGLLAVLLTAAEGKTPEALLQQDPLALFDTLGLRAQLSASRSSGLAALAARIKNIAEQEAASQ
ncbi:putative Fe-S metabolism associated protein [Pectobacterium atrosepticum SCRI1043]|uniref:Fe-S metabolism associated protein n=1 Tax=Pectobacterium atrosepticum (strain SCRI 1043 / ATCC BAA-672) TaxID=218491 RepID=Q6D8G3_PECAS|nr:cysteine desulfurase sulfur acceptor subunit CsdE [Pectobacterium atrosepticum]GKV86187.1 cysteine desulfurase, sulfur acceptor subunit CsdE [Pectobacterium carotovorum subsp. carotovorum]ATY89812.1 cysteine desulfurase sulfur acceptor subunit CsdE [Pectobacterium atrosepticum]KFX23186.1 Fe-S metabolism protein SufE [Pectobacterium atrosepticum]MBL0894615.1 cysteine desulfurase sulfur acceptor subunit CsdE [Pectobacterium atrosepticum]MCA6980366.1 cysteine desulfurase sulfur acceptor subuni